MYRQFGFLFTFVALLASLFFVCLCQGVWIFVFAFSLAIVGISVTIFRPIWFFMPTIIWMFIGRAIGRILSPLVLAFLYYVIITPIGILSGMLGRDLLGKRKSGNTNWTDTPAYSADTNFYEQF